MTIGVATMNSRIQLDCGQSKTCENGRSTSTPPAQESAKEPTIPKQSITSPLFPQDAPAPDLAQFRIRHLPIPNAEIRRSLYARDMRRRVSCRFRALVQIPTGVLEAPFQDLIMFPLPSRVRALGHLASSLSPSLRVGVRVSSVLRLE